MNLLQIHHNPLLSLHIKKHLMESHQNEFQLLTSRLRHFNSIPYRCTISAPRDFQYNLFSYCIRAKARNIFWCTMCVQRPAHFIGIHRHFQITGRILSSFQDKQCCNYLSVAPVSHHISLPPKFTVLTQVLAG